MADWTKRIGVLLLPILFFIAGVSPANAQSPVPDPQSPIPDPLVARISFTDDASLATLTERLDVWEVHRQEGYVVAQITRDQWQWLNLLGYEVTVDEEKTAALHRPRGRTPGQTSGIPGYACYRTVEETHADMAQLAADHPDLAQWFDIGDTYDKVTAGGPPGYDYYVLVLTNRNLDVPKGKLMVLAAVHAREYTTAETAARFAELLIDGYGVDPDLTWLLDYNEIHVIPQGNPDGRKFAEQGYSWRKNTDNPDACAFPYYGVDLNRNSSFLWNICQYGCSSSDACAVTYRGPFPASEPETQAIEAYVDAVFADQRGDDIDAPAPPETNGVFISLHSYGNLVIYPWDWTDQDAPNMPELRRLGRKFGYFTRYSVCNTQNCLYPVDGSHTDYAYGEKGVASYTFELGTSFFQSCSYFESTILQPNLDALLYAARSARRPYVVAAGPDVVDVTVAPNRVAAGTSITLTATADDTRYFSNGFGVEPSQAVGAVRYTVDAPSWLSDTGGSHMAAADGAFDEPVETARIAIDTSGWPLGQHILFVESQDVDDNWGVPTAVFVEIVDAHGVDLAQPPPIRFADAGTTVSHTLMITNTGSGVDSFALATVQSSWPLSIPAQIGPLAAGEGAAVALQVTVPATATIGAADVAVIEVASAGDPGKVRLATVQTIVDGNGAGSFSHAAATALYLPLIGNER